MTADCRIYLIGVADDDATRRRPAEHLGGQQVGLRVRPAPVGVLGSYHADERSIEAKRLESRLDSGLWSRRRERCRHLEGRQQMINAGPTRRACSQAPLCLYTLQLISVQLEGTVLVWACIPNDLIIQVGLPLQHCCIHSTQSAASS